MKAWRVGLAVLLGGCAAAGGWAKPGADAAVAARAYDECRATAAAAVAPEAGINQDILATRQADLQRSGVARIGAQSLRDETRDRRASIIASCMKSKGYARPGGGPRGLFRW